MSFLSATPADRLVKPVSPQELNERSIVQIVNSCNSHVLRQLRKGEAVSIGASQTGVTTHPNIDLREHYDAASLARVSIIHCGIAFMTDGSVVYQNLDPHFGSVIERTARGPLAPKLCFQLLGSTIAAYLVTNRVSNAAEPCAAPGLAMPPWGVGLKNQDEITIGLNYCAVRPGGLAGLVARSALKLQAPDEVVRDGQLILPRLAVYIR